MLDSATYALAVPVFHGVDLLGSFLDGVEAQFAPPSRCLFIDSSRDDATSALLQARGYETVRIPSATFDHGGTRNLALEILEREGFELVVFMTQDAILATPTSLQHLLEPLRSGHAKAAFGRQVPRRGASLLERVNREVRYPPTSYRANDLTGQRRYFISNAFAAYHLPTLRAVGGFPAPSLFAEDAVASFRLQNQGHVVRYVADAIVEHSHPVSLPMEFRRFFDVGVASRQPGMPREWGSRASGARATLQEWTTARRLGGVGPFLRSVAVSVVRAAGLTIGRQKWLPRSIGRRLAYSKAAYESVVAWVADGRK